jgi:serine/threonine-protein kinase
VDTEKWQKVKAVFYAALDLPTAERLSFVRAECRDDTDLQTEIEKLLQSHQETDNFIEKPIFTTVKNLVTDEKHFTLIGKKIGVYQIQKEIGRGGMGAVYLAERADGEFHQQVAVKLIKRGLDTDEIIRRFRHERQILANLDHPYITRLIDGGTTIDGLPFLIMDYVEGLPLISFANKHKLTLHERLKLFLQICSAVQYAHQHLIIHRDLKPSNILVTNDKTPRLLDFGIAKLLSSDSNVITQNTIADLSIMTPEYAAPEQVCGEKVTTATDVYALGVVLYELLTDSRPYSFETKTISEIIRIVCETEPSAPSAISNFKFQISNSKPEKINHQDQNRKSQIANRRSLKGDLDNIILMALRKEPERRYSSVEQFAADIHRYLNGLPVMARHDTFAYRAGKFIQRNKAGVIAASGIAVSLIAGIISTYRQSRIARTQRDKALAEARKAEKINHFLQKILNSADPRTQGKDVKVVQMLRLAAESLATDFDEQPEIAAELNTTIGLTYLSLGFFDSAESHLRRALKLRTEVFGLNHQQTAMSFNNLGQLLQTKGKLNAAEPFYRRALQTLRKLDREDSLETASVLDNFGYLLILKGKNKEAIDVHHQELSIRRRFLGENHPKTGQTLGKLANAVSVTGDKKAAEILHRQALRIMRDFYPNDHPDLAQALVNVASSIYVEKPAEAKKLCLEALEMRQKLFGTEHYEVAWMFYNLAYFSITWNEIENAEHYANQVLSMQKTNVPTEHPVISSSLLILGRCFLARNKPDEAETLLRKCLHLRRQTLPPEHWLLDTTNSILGECLFLQGDVQKAKTMLINSYNSLQRKLGAEHEQTRIAEERNKRLLGL